MKILWIVDSAKGDWQRGFDSNTASCRYRAINPATALHQQGHQVDIVQFNQLAGWPSDGLQQGDAVVVSKYLPFGDERKMHAESQMLLAVVDQWRSGRIAVVADFCDDRFDDPRLQTIWTPLATMADVRVAGSEVLAERLRARFEAPVVVIGDPLDSPAGTPAVFRRPGVTARWARVAWPLGQRPPSLELVWYGHLSNLPALERWAHDLVPTGARQPWTLTIVTTPNDDVDAFVLDFNRRHGPRTVLRFERWTWQAQWDAVARAHIVLVPADMSDARKTVKTANRLTDALNAGRYAIASPLPAYQPFADYALLTTNPAAEVEHYLREPAACEARVARGQAVVRAQLAPEVVARAWLDAMKLAMAQRA